MKKILLFLFLAFFVFSPLSTATAAEETAVAVASGVDTTVETPSDKESSTNTDTDASDDKAIPDIVFTWVSENLTTLLVIVSGILTAIIGVAHKKGLAPVVALVTALIKRLFGTKEEPGILATSEALNEESRKKIESAVTLIVSARDDIAKAVESCEQSRAIVTCMVMAVNGFEEILRTLIHGASYPDYQKDKLERLLDETKACVETALAASAGVSEATVSVEGGTDEKLD